MLWSPTSGGLEGPPPLLDRLDISGRDQPLLRRCRITSLSVGRMEVRSLDGLLECGRIQEGYWADLVIFDPDRVVDTATYDDPKQEPEGIRAVIVNGQVAYEDGRHTGVGAGRMLRYRSPVA